VANIFPVDAVTSVVSGATDPLRDNIGTILGVFAFIVGLSIVLALLDQAKTDRYLDRESKFWKGR